MAEKKPVSLTVNLSDEGRLQSLKTIIDYEAAIRGLTIGQTFIKLIEEAIDLDSYPEEIRERLDSIKEGRRRQAILKSLAVDTLDKSA